MDSNFTLDSNCYCPKSYYNETEALIPPTSGAYAILFF